ncbi:uncharacterized protein NECHADRAFT_85208 [Fusarium vanettenii 77-13-4]|uniref:Protein kinase domain-containing protein n=1 Tax=Fusarium vanettenii (strain ATCC MYA-4622 / CBS 123669 / FGSC 9596 / NRRL 45880 / 77-13-4) TaxID=660122 RepID=C7YVA7_FUSV7|nr:uncharacterized protein NECHADRAFT_85208 [Fusarium vanettenii 77-13-4]EEU44549.1 predicted protein [Fusarium vanettenii 77-13-4]
MSGKGVLQGQTSPILDLEDLYETTVEELQHLLGDPDHHRWSLEDEIRIDDWLVQLCVWGSDLDVESGALQKLREKEAVIVRGDLDRIRSSIAVAKYLFFLEPRARSAENALDRLGLNIQNLCELSNSLQIAIDLGERKGPAFKVKEYMDLVSWKLAPPQPSDLKDVDQESSGTHTSLDTTMQDAETGFSADLLSVLHRCQRLSASGDPFWPDGLLKRIMTRERVLESLDSHAQESIDIIVLPEEVDPSLSGRGLIKIYALLILLGKSDQILVFIEEGLLDKDLPLRFDERSLFDSQQWGFAVPSLRLAPDGSPNHYDLDRRAIIPWAYDSTYPVLEIAGDNDGEVSEVHRITIDPDSQGLWEPLQEMGLDDTFFALKTLSMEHGDKDTFSMELDQLRTLNVTRYQHLVTLLASISYNGSFGRIDTQSDRLMIWKRCDGSYDNLRGLREPWAPSTRNEGTTGTSAPTDPLAKINLGDVSPRYWRLRHNSQGDTSSQTYDLWSLGYVFLEFVAWFLGGRELVHLLEIQWISQPPSGSVTPPNREAMECLEQLRLHQNRNSFTEETLSIIEKRMLSVVSTDADKTYCSNLQEDFRRLYLQCGGDLDAYPPPSGLVSSRREPPLASAESKTPNQAKINTPGQDDTGTLDVAIDTASGSHRNS